MLDSVDTPLSILRERGLLVVLSEVYTSFDPHYKIEGRTEEEKILNRRRICLEFIQRFNLEKWKEAISSVQTSYPDSFSFNITWAIGLLGYWAIVKAYRK